MTVRLTDTEISELERRRKIVACVAVVCRVCGFRQHAKPGRLPNFERCPMGCTGYYSGRTAETHWHAADGAGPVSQYAVS